MYGQIHCIIRELVKVKFGDETWDDVIKQSGLDMHTDFIVFKRYPDPLTYKLVGTVAECLGLSTEDVLKAFGGYFLTYCLRHGYDKMLKTLGGDITSFIQNLDSLHSLLALSYKGIEPPSFRCEEINESELILHYNSMRPGLYPIVIGLVEAVGMELFSQKCTLTVIKQTTEETGSKKIQHYTVFRVWTALKAKRHFSKSYLCPVQLVGPKQRNLMYLRSSCSAAEATNVPGESNVDTVATKLDSPSNSMLCGADFCSAFPYHIVLGEGMTILQVGNNVRRATSMKITKGMPFNDLADIVQPVIAPTMENIFKFINNVFIIAIYKARNDKTQAFNLKGQMCWLRHSCKMIFISSPRMTSLNELLEMNVYLADIPLYDCTRELVLLNQQRIAEIDIAKKLDETTHELQKMSEALEEEKKKTEDLLHQMLPMKVAQQLTQGISVKAEKFECVTILFSDIVTFTNIAGACGPMDVVNMLNDLYHRFDTRTNLHDVYKVETVGDAYMGVAGAPDAQEDHAERIADFGMDVLEESGNVLSPDTGKPLQIRVGIHSGPVVAGVVGKKMPRYCLFGDTVNTTSRMESYGVPGRIHLSETTYSKLYSYGYIFLERGVLNIKGKGNMNTFFLVGCLERKLQQPEDEFSKLPALSCPDPIVKIRQPKPRNDCIRKSFNFFQKSSSAGYIKDKRAPINLGKPPPNKNRSTLCRIT